MASRVDEITPEAVVVRCLAINDDFAAWHASLPPHQTFEVITTANSDPTDPIDYYYTWTSLRCALHYTSSWMTLILVHGTVLQQLEILSKGESGESNRSSKDYTAQVQRSSTFTLSLIHRICASVRYYVSLCGVRSSSVSPGGSQPRFIPCAAAIHSILKPLFVAGDSLLCPPAERAWIINQLRTIGTDIGMRQASFLADNIAQKQSTTDWLLADNRRGQE